MTSLGVQVIYKPRCHYQNFSPLANWVYFIAIIYKTPLHNGNCPITNLITEMGVAHTVGLCHWQYEFSSKNSLTTFWQRKGQLLALNEKRARKEEEKSEFAFLLTTGRHPKNSARRG